MTSQDAFATSVAVVVGIGAMAVQALRVLDWWVRRKAV